MVVATLLSPCNSTLVRGFLGVRVRVLNQHANGCFHVYQIKRLSRRFVVFNATEGSAESGKSEESKPSWARPDSDEPPPWAQDEGGKGSAAQQGLEVPFFVYLLASAITAIAAIGSIFEYINQRPVFGVLNSNSVFYAPLLGFFAFTGIPTSAFLWFKSIQVANKEAEEQDRRDGFL
ncbi:polyglutamine-binding protein 1-like isoform X1 [Hibiscus syriacus]|uniref:Polyglutamine-binding protein 1-like isoform X1 n=1 Tax=Hibiscus syriacus TaxID=106335 RepID=A0A6A3AQF8_HIBSY|nr:uncharacterized protein LOC120123468 [Hibiscus syriacus]XP_038998285.1 uncharacterized protein LOC120123468 [Hibiscus syriacus]KAE8706456.1 polyglutamine-binding protein 1-like isoform X1 [Hibiscus syriacus]